MVTALFILFVVLFAMAVPIFVVLSLSTLGAFWMHSAIPLETIVQRLFAGLDKFALMAIPFFIVAANVMSAGGCPRRIIAVANVLVGPLPGGLAMATVVACMFFGAISGSSPARVVAMGGLLYPALIQGGYDKRFAIALIVASGHHRADIIPPSITMIVYGAVTGASVGALFVSGFGAGVAYGLGFMGYSYYYAKRHKIPSLPWPTVGRGAGDAGDAKWGLGMPILIIGGIYGGNLHADGGRRRGRGVRDRGGVVHLSGDRLPGILGRGGAVRRQHGAGDDPPGRSVRVRLHPHQ